MASPSSSSVPGSVFAELEFSEANNILLMALMEETNEDIQDHDQYYTDDRLMSMIQSLEAEINSNRADPHQWYDKMGQVGRGHDCSASAISVNSDWVDMEVVSDSSSSSYSFDEEMTSAWSPCAASWDDSGDYLEFYYGVLLENYNLPQEASDVVF